MGAEHDALLGFGMEHTHDVLSVNALAIEQTRAEVLHNDRVGIFVQLCRKPFGTVGMSLRLWHTWAEAGLLGHKLIGRVGIERRNNDGLLGFFDSSWCFFRLLFAARGQKQCRDYDDK